MVALCAVRRVQGVDVTRLPDNDKKAFFINLYNALVIHATVVRGRPKAALARASFFSTSAYARAHARSIPRIGRPLCICGHDCARAGTRWGAPRTPSTTSSTACCGATGAALTRCAGGRRGAAGGAPAQR